jgi:uncharacterized repeat protein (TIGR01451 family)
VKASVTGVRTLSGTRPQHRILIALLVMTIITAVVSLGATRAEAASFSAVADFESGLSAGDTVSTLSSGNGISGANLGTISVFGSTPTVSGNAAMVYDATCGGSSATCTGTDTDLFAPGYGNILMVSEDGDGTNPDDSASAQSTLTFGFGAWGDSGLVTVNSLDVIDIETSAATIDLYDAADALLASVPIPPTGDGGTGVVAIDQPGVRRMVVNFRGSGAIDGLDITGERVIMDLWLDKTVSDDQVFVGEQTTFTITVGNDGPDPATGVVVTDTLPAGLSHVSHAGDGAYDPATGVWTIGALAVDETVSMTLTVTVDEIGLFTNVAEVTAANEPDSDSVPNDGTGDDWDDASVTAIERPHIIDLELAKSADPQVINPGDSSTFTVSVVNQGPDDATGVVVTDTLPAGLSYVSDTGGGAYDGASGVWTIGDLAVNATVSLDIVVSGTELGTHTNVAEVTAANEQDSDSTPNDGEGDDWDDATITIVEVDPIIDLELTKDVDPSSVSVGDETVFTISVVNQGPDDASGVVVTDTLPAGLSYVSDTGGGAYDGVSGVWTIGDLAVGDSVSMTLTVTVDEAGSFTNEAEVTAANELDSDSTPGDGEGDDWDDATVTAAEVLASALIGDTVWFDDDKDGVQDPGEKGVSGVTVTLTNTDTDTTTSMVTDSEGKYLFAALDPGNYVVKVTKSTFPESTSLTTVGSFTIELSDGEDYLTADFGIAGSLPITGLNIDEFMFLGVLFLALGGALVGSGKKFGGQTAA